MSVIKGIESGRLELIVGKPDGLVSVNDDGLRSELLRLAKIGEKMQWIPVSERLPANSVSKNGIVKPKIVVCTDGHHWWKAYYAKKHEFNCEVMGYDGEGDIDEETGAEYWIEGWYERANDDGDTDWALGSKITYWMELPLLPEPPKEDTP